MFVHRIASHPLRRVLQVCALGLAHTPAGAWGGTRTHHTRAHARTTTIPRTTWSLASSSSSMASIIALEELDSIVHLASRLPPKALPP